MDFLKTYLKIVKVISNSFGISKKIDFDTH